MKSFTIRSLTPLDAELISTALLYAPKDYNQYFKPFKFDKLIIASILNDAKKDMY